MKSILNSVKSLLATYAWLQLMISLFITTMLAIPLCGQTIVGTITGPTYFQGARVYEAGNKVCAYDGGTDTVFFYDGTTFAQLGSVFVGGDDLGGMELHQASGKLYLLLGHPTNKIAVVNVITGTFVRYLSRTYSNSIFADPFKLKQDHSLGKIYAFTSELTQIDVSNDTETTVPNLSALNDSDDIAVNPITHEVFISRFSEFSNNELVIVNGSTLQQTIIPALGGEIGVNWLNNKVYFSVGHFGDPFKIFNRSNGSITSIFADNVNLGFTYNPTGNRMYTNSFPDPISTIFEGASDAFFNLPMRSGMAAVAVCYATNHVFYGGNNGSGLVAVLDDATQLLEVFPLPFGNLDFTIDQSRKRVYAISSTITVIQDTEFMTRPPVYLGSSEPGGVIFSVDPVSKMVVDRTHTFNSRFLYDRVMAVRPGGGRLYTPYETITAGDGVDIHAGMGGFDGTAGETDIASFNSGGGSPIAVVVSPDNNRIYVTNSDSTNVGVINGVNYSLITSVPVGLKPWGAAITPDGTKLYVANKDSHTVSVINTASNTVTGTIPVGVNPWGVVINPSGTRAYVSNSGTNTISVIDLNSNTVIATVTVGSLPHWLAITPDGKDVYVTNRGSNSVSIIKTGTNTVTNTITGFNHSGGIGIGILPDGSEAWVTRSNSSGVSTFTVINTSTLAITPHSVPYLAYSMNSVALVEPGAKVAGHLSDGLVPVVGALVRAKQNGVEKGIATTNAEGDYSIFNLPPGTYDVEISAPNYVTQTLPGQVGNIGRTTIVNVTLAPICAAVTVLPVTLSSGVINNAYNQALGAQGGSAPYIFAQAGGALPPGLTLTSGGILSGTPTTLGAFSFGVIAVSANGCLGSRIYTLSIICPTIIVNPETVPSGLVSSPYPATAFTATGGTAPYAFMVLGTLPTGLNLSNGTLSGTPLQPGNFSITIKATDASGCVGTRAFTLAITCPVINFDQTTIRAGTIGSSYGLETLTVTGGTAPYTFSLSAGILPTGMSFSSFGTFSGTPTQSGNFPITVKATDVRGCMGTRNYTLVINCTVFSITPASLPPGTLNVAYAPINFSSTGFFPPYTFALAGTLPNGMSFVGRTLSGTPTQIGNFPLVVTGTDANGCSVSSNYTLVINCLTITLSPITLPSGTIGAAYSQTRSATPAGTYSFAVMQGTLPNGLTLSSTGALTGTPNTSGGFPITIQATGTNGCMGTQSYTLTINCQMITVNPANPALPIGRAGTAYSQTFTQTGGTDTVNFSLSAGALPAGLTLAAGGLLSGTPSVFGPFSFTIRATDANNCFGERAYTLALNPACGTITLNPAALANGFQGTAYSQTLTATGGAPPYTFAVTTGSLPGGLTLASGGGLTGTPTAAGTYTFTVTATDNTGCTGTRAYTVIISSNGLMFYPLPAPLRLLDTRIGTSPNACFQPNVPIVGGTVRLIFARNFCGIPANAQALTGNVTTVNSGGGYLTLFPSGATQPTVASTNYGVNEIVNNVFTVGLGAGDGSFNIFAQSTTHVVVDVTGYYAPPNTGGLYFHPLPSPVRLLETRAGQPVGCFKPGTPLPGGVDTTQQVTGVACVGIPAAARAIVGNATTVGPQSGGYLTLFPADAARPLVASSNYNAGQIVNGPFTVGLSVAGQFKLFTTATTDLVVDVLGYYSTEVTDANGVGLLFTPLAHPVRLLETRATPANLTGCFKPNAPLNGNQVYTQTARGVCDSLTIPAAALAVVGNATVVSPLSGGYLTLWPSGALQPTVATSNYSTGDVGNRHFIVGLGNADGAFKMFSSARTDLVIDLSGYFAP